MIYLHMSTIFEVNGNVKIKNKDKKVINPNYGTKKNVRIHLKQKQKEEN